MQSDDAAMTVPIAQPDIRVPVATPAQGDERDDAQGIQEATALCLSGGGYRAMVFHVGVLWRLNEVGELRNIARFSSVSGGSITAGVLGLSWKALEAANFSNQAFISGVVTPIRKMASTNVDIESILVGALLPGVTVADLVAREYRRVLFGAATLQDLPDLPRFVFNATNTQSGALCRMSKPYLWDWRVGRVSSPKLSMAEVVGASSAFPPVLSPAVLKFDAGAFDPGTGEDLQSEPSTRRMVLTDGGVYDNLGLETAFKRYRTLLVSDAGGQMKPDGRPPEDWARHSKRVLDLVDNQVRNLRKRQLLDALTSQDPVHQRHGAFWSARSNIADYQLPDALPAPFERTQELAAIPTRLDSLDSLAQDRLINWGYAICDAAIRRHWKPELPNPGGIPYPASGI